jgi:hypothetical protein
MDRYAEWSPPRELRGVVSALWRIDREAVSLSGRTPASLRS